MAALVPGNHTTSELQTMACTSIFGACACVHNSLRTFSDGMAFRMVWHFGWYGIECARLQAANEERPVRRIRAIEKTKLCTIACDGIDCSD
jgi:hypothetical protein